MTVLKAGTLWALIFVLIESGQFVYFGSLFQSVSSFLFGFLVFSVIAVLFIGHTAVRAPDELKLAFSRPGDLIGLNVAATLAWMAYLLSVEYIEPAVVYTISAGVMPIAAWLSQKFRIAKKKSSINGFEKAGMILLLIAIVYLSVITLSGGSGFVKNGSNVAMWGILLAIGDGILFTWMLVYSENLDRVGVGPSAIFGLRFPLYVVVAGLFIFSGMDSKPVPPSADIVWIAIVGLLLTVPHLYALQKAVANISTAAISALITIGPFVIFLLQIFEGRVAFSIATLSGLAIYFIGSGLSVYGTLRKSHP